MMLTAQSVEHGKPNKLNYIIMNKNELIRQIKFIIDGVELGENPFFIINKIKNIIEQETQTE